MEAPADLETLAAGIRDFSRHHVLVVGDFFLDEYVEGDMIDISKEGPIPVVRFRSRVTAAGAAGNLASSIRNLGARVSTVGIVGEDENGKALVDELDGKGIDTSGLVRDSEKPTLKYGKIRAGVENAPSREILRLDVLPDGPATGSLEDAVLENIAARVADVDGVIVLDQIGHLVTERVLDALAAHRERHGVFLQGSSRDRIADFHDFDLVVPNDSEAIRALGRSEWRLEEAAEVGEELRKLGRHRRVLLTLGPDGMACLDDRDGAPPVTRIPSFASSVVDVTGAGDAVSSTVILAQLEGWDLATSAWCASHAAAIALRHVGTHHVHRDELLDAL